LIAAGVSPRPVCSDPEARLSDGGKATGSLSGGIHPEPGESMSSIVKVVEVIAQSEKSFDHAVEEALREASQTIENIKEVWVSGQKAIVENNKIVEYRVTTKISFLVKGHG
jgi:dodecin